LRECREEIGLTGEDIISIDNKKYQIEFGTNNYFKCDNCSKEMSDEIKKIVDFNNIDSSMTNVENYFKLKKETEYSQKYSTDLINLQNEKKVI